MGDAERDDELVLCAHEGAAVPLERVERRARRPEGLALELELADPDEEGAQKLFHTAQDRSGGEAGPSCGPTGDGTASPTLGFRWQETDTGS